MPGGPAAHRTRETPDAREAMEEDDGDEPKRAAVRSLARPVAAAGVCPRPRADGGARCPGPPDSGDGTDGPGTACRRSRPARPAPRALNPSPPLPRQSHAERPEGPNVPHALVGANRFQNDPDRRVSNDPAARVGSAVRVGRPTSTGRRDQGSSIVERPGSPGRDHDQRAVSHAHPRRPRDVLRGRKRPTINGDPPTTSAGRVPPGRPWPAGSGPHNHAIGRPGLPGRDHDQRAVSSRAPWTTPRCPAGSEATDQVNCPDCLEVLARERQVGNAARAWEARARRRVARPPRPRWADRGNVRAK